MHIVLCKRTVRVMSQAGPPKTLFARKLLNLRILKPSMQMVQSKYVLVTTMPHLLLFNVDTSFCLLPLRTKMIGVNGSNPPKFDRVTCSISDPADPHYHQKRPHYIHRLFATQCARG